VFESWIRGRDIVLRKNPDYWRKDKWGNRLPYVDKVVFRQVREITAVEAEIEKGNIDSAYIYDSAYPKYKNHALFREHLVEGVEFYTTHVGFNFEIPGAPWRDRRVRQAINHAIDRKAIVDVVRQGMAFTATGPLPPGMLPGDQAREAYEYSPEKAKRLLAEAGYANGFAVKIITSEQPQRVAGAEAVAGYLAAVGIRLQIEVLDVTAMRARQEQGKFDWYYANSGGEGHPLTFLQRAFHSRYLGSGGNWTHYRNPIVDQLLDRAADARDVATMTRLVREAEKVVFADAVWAFVSYNKGVLVNQPYVRGLRATAIDMDWPPLEEVWLAWAPKRR
jgi:ABC-type transport system substrate-binding protein